MAYLYASVPILLVLVFLWLIFPSFTKNKDTEKLDGIHIAHRGLHDKYSFIPENSLPAFRRAIDFSFAIEIDVHLTKDGQVVVFHDGDTLRMTGVQKEIKSSTLSELKELNLLSTNEKIPTLKECLDLIDGQVPLLIEFKWEGNGEKLCEKANKILKNYKGLYFIQSFHPQILYWYRRNRKDICRGQLSCKFTEKALYKKLAGNLLFGFLGRPHFVSYCHQNGSSFMRKFVTKLGAFPVGWTFNSEEQEEKGRKYFKTFIFENYIPKK